MITTLMYTCTCIGQNRGGACMYVFPYNDHDNLLINKCHLAIHVHVATSTV